VVEVEATRRALAVVTDRAFNAEISHETKRQHPRAPIELQV
jgi:hypothetical protein